jgi:NADP-dependent 3-hydroxy acid dehydrogenase YdfG
MVYFLSGDKHEELSSFLAGFAPPGERPINLISWGWGTIHYFHQGRAQEEAHIDGRENMATTADGKLAGQVVLITGASSGIGGAIARAFLNEGADLVVVARRSERLQALAEEAQKSGRRCAVVVGDVREEETARRAVQTATQQLGQLDMLVNNAGIGRYANLTGTSADDYDAMMDTNMRSTFLFTRHVVPVLLERGTGAIITIASMAGVMGFAGEAVYCATKFAQVGFTQALDRELRPHGIKVGVVCPGGVKTEFAIGTGRTEEGVAASGMLEPEDVAAAVLLIATQPRHSRIAEIRMRPMVEPLFGRDPE